MVRFLFFIALFTSSLSCQKDIVSPTQTPVWELEPDLDPVKVTFSDAGVYFIKKERKDIVYTSREATMIPTIELGSDGELYCAWYANSSAEAGEGSGAYVTISVSTDSGNVWRDNELIIAPIDPKDRIFEECLWRDPNGDVHLYWSRSKNGWWDGTGGVWECIIKYEDGEYIRTSEPRMVMNKGIMLNKPIVIHGGDSILYPQYVYNVPSSIQKGIAGAYVYMGKVGEKDETPTSKGKIQIAPDTLNKHNASIEPYFLEVDSDTIRSYIRTFDGIYYSSSTRSSGLKRWKPYRKLLTIGNNPSMRFFIRRLSSGNILLITCNSKDIALDFYFRKNMTAYLSLDNGATFPYKLLIDDREAVSYPDATQDTDGTIYITYDRERYGAQEILLAKITEADIVNDKKPKLKKVNYF